MLENEPTPIIPRGQRAGGSDTVFLQAVYHDILGWPLDSASAAGWSTALAHLDHAGVAALILPSPEAQADRVQAGYQRYLHRPADPPGLASWLLQLQHGLSDYPPYPRNPGILAHSIFFLT